MSGGVLVRLAAPELDALEHLLLADGDREAACFVRLGWRETPQGLVLALAALDPPPPGAVLGEASAVRIAGTYAREVALAAETHPLAAGLVHTHPAGAGLRPSPADDAMDDYFAGYFADFAPGRPFASLILARVDGDTGPELALSGRVRVAGTWRPVTRVAAARRPDVVCWPDGVRPDPAPMPPERVARLTSAFGREAYQRLQRATVALVGAGATGSAAIPILARAGVGRLIVVDADHASASNLERLHGSVPQDVVDRVPKVAIARRHVASFAPDVVVEAHVGKLPQPEIVDAVIRADLLLGCTDQHASRLAVADIARRFAIPAIDIGGLIEGADGIVTGQLVQLVRFLPDDPCPRCRGMISEVRVAQELMSPAERLSAQAQADAARDRGERPDPIATAIPQIDTVSWITTTGGTLAAGFAIGWLTGRFDPRFERLQLDLVSDCLGAVDRPQRARAGCVCTRTRGFADQGADTAPVVAPPHWEPARTLA
ncbi:MAG: HesA/MoeB/ThiF family protein [Salinarimonas sp.]